MHRIHTSTFKLLSFNFLKLFYQIKQFSMQAYSQFPCFAPSFTTQNIAISRPCGGYFFRLTTGIGMDTLLPM